jgi:hypothetical protein
MTERRSSAAKRRCTKRITKKKKRENKGTCVEKIAGNVARKKKYTRHAERNTGKESRDDTEDERQTWNNNGEETAK